MTKPIRRPGSAMYYARRVIPKDLRNALGRTEIWKSLETSDLGTAKDLERLQQSAWSAQFAHLRKAAADAAQGDIANPRPAPEEDPWERAKFDLAEDARMAEIDAAVDADPFLSFQRDLRIEERDRRLGAEALRWDALERKAAQRAAETDLDDVVRLWASEKKPAAKSVDRMYAVVKRFRADVEPLTLQSIESDHVYRFKSALIEGTSSANANTILRNFNTLLRFAMTEARLRQDNPANGISITVNADPEDDVRPFDLEALRKVFSSPVFALDERPAGGAGEAAYWLPLMALFSGARLNEIGQLRTSDVFELPYVDDEDEERDAWVIRITADKADGLKLKNKWTARRIPVHPKLSELGFLDYVARAKAEGRKRLFPDLQPDKYGTVTANWSKWFGRYLRTTCGVLDDRMVFHSFRHAFKDYARENDIPEDVNDAITGHSGKTVARRYGSPLAYPIKPMIKAMARYRVAGLALPSRPPELRGCAVAPSPQFVE